MILWPLTEPRDDLVSERKLVDAATSEFERSCVQVADMVTRQPWADDLPVRVLSE